MVTVYSTLEPPTIVPVLVPCEKVHFRWSLVIQWMFDMLLETLAFPQFLLF